MKQQHTQPGSGAVLTEAERAALVAHAVAVLESCNELLRSPMGGYVIPAPLRAFGAAALRWWARQWEVWEWE